MASVAKIHWSEGRRDDDVLWVTLCGGLAVEVADRPDDVTCKKCLKKIRKMRPDTGAHEYVESVLHRRAPIEFAEAPALVDPLSGLPFVSPFIWGTIKDPQHWCAHCPACSWFNQLEADANAAPWKKQHSVIAERTRWRSVNEALRWYTGLRSGGYTQSTIGDALMRIGTLGAVIRGNATGSSAIDEADDAHTVEGALAGAYTGISRRGLSRGERLWVLFEVALGAKPHEVAAKMVASSALIDNFTGPMASAVATDGRWVVYQYLRERGMVPERR